MGKSKKLISKNDIKKYVKEKGEDELLKDDLIEFQNFCIYYNNKLNYIILL